MTDTTHQAADRPADQPARQHVHATQDDGVVRALSEIVGGPVGSRAARARWGTPLAVLLLVTSVVFALGMVSKNSCAQRDWDAGNLQFTHLCYSDIPYSYTGTGLVQLGWPYSSDRQFDGRYAAPQQPALVGLWTYAAARVTHVLVGSPDLDRRSETSTADLGQDDTVHHEEAVYTAVNAVGLGLVALLITLALTRAAGRRPWDAAAFAAAPVLATAGLVSWDLLGVLGAAFGLWAWSRGRPVLAGVAVGLGAAAGVWPALLLVAFGVCEVRRRGAPGVAERVLPAAVTALAAWAVGNAPAFLSDRDRWAAYWHLALHRPPEDGSWWAIIDQTAGIGTTTVTVLSDVLMVAWAVGVIVIALSARVTPRVSQVAFLLVAGVALLAASYRPQEVVWLLPFAALARPRWRDLLIWQAGEVLYFAMIWWKLGGQLAPGDNGSPAFYWIAIGIRLVCLGWLVGVVVRDVVTAEADPVAQRLDDESDHVPMAPATLVAPAGPVGPDQVTSTRSNDVVV